MIVLARHGHTDAGDRCVGRTDVPLSATGREQAAHLAEVLEGAGFARLCSSPSGRAVDTLAPLADRLGMTPDRISGLDEINMGPWDGLSFAEIRIRFPEQYEARARSFGDYRTPGGESFNDVADRAMGALVRLAAWPQPVLAVTHAGVIRAVLCRVTGTPMDELFRFRPGHVQCTVLSATSAGLCPVATCVAPEDVPALLRS